MRQLLLVMGHKQSHQTQHQPMSALPAVSRAANLGPVWAALRSSDWLAAGAGMAAVACVAISGESLIVTVSVARKKEL